MRRPRSRQGFSRSLPLAVVLLLAVLMLAGCPFASDQPLSDPGEAVVDQALVGTWRMQDSETGEWSQITFSALDVHELVLSAPGAEEGSVEESRAFVTPIGDELFLNVHEVSKDSDVWFLARYRVDAGRLVLSVVDDGLFDGMSFAAPPELRAFVQENLADPRLYTPADQERQDMILERVSN